MDPETILQHAQQFSEREDYTRALEEYGKLLRLNPGDTRVLLRVGDLQVRTHNLGGAIETYDQAAQYYAAQGHGLKAVAVYKQVRELVLVQEQREPGWADRYQHVVERLCGLYLELGLANDALRVLDDEAARLRNHERDEESLRVYHRMTALAPNIPLPYLRLGEGLYRIGQIDEALTAFWSATQLLLGTQRTDDALRVLERMLHVKPHPYHAKIAARLYLEKGTEPEGKQALSRLQICFQADPTDLETLQMLSQAFAQIGQDDRAIEVQKELARLAHEQGRRDVWEETLSVLRDVAPDDEHVQALLHMAPPDDHNSRSASGLPPGGRVISSVAPAPPMSMAPSSLPPAGHEMSSMPPSSIPISLIPMSSMASAPPPPSAGRHSPPPKPHSEHPSRPSSSRPPRTFAPPPKPSKGASMRPEANAPSSPSSARGVAPPLPRKFRTSKPPPLPASFLAQAAAASGRPTLEAPALNSSGYEAAGVPGETTLQSNTKVAPDSSRSEAAANLAALEAELFQDGSPAERESLVTAHATLSRVQSSTAVTSTTLERVTGHGVEEDSVSGAESYAAVLERTHRALTDAKAYRGLSLFHKAIETVQHALETDPRSIELREMLRDLFTDLGDRDGAIEEMLTMAEIYVEFDRPDHARAVLENILDEESGCNEAREMLQRLSAEAVADRISVPMTLLESSLPPPELLSPLPASPPDAAPLAAAAVPMAPPPSATEQSRPPIPPPPPSSRTAAAPTPPSSRSIAAPPASVRSAGVSLPPPPPAQSSLPETPASFQSSEPAQSSPTALTQSSEPPPTTAAAPPPPMSLDETLEEVEFFASRGMLAEAERLLAGQLQRFPDHPLLLESLQDVRDSLADSARPADLSAKLDKAQRPKSSDSSEFDLQASLGELERAVRDSMLPPQPGHVTPQVDVDGLFERFKTSVKQQVPDADSKTHYDLGIAYKDLNLLDDAIDELNLASREAELECRCQTLIGNIYAEQNVWDKASKAYARALSAMRKSKAEETGLYYELGHVSDMMGQMDQAIYYFRQVLRRDQNYRDARDRVAQLRTQRQRTASGRPRGADEEVDRAFEDILGD